MNETAQVPGRNREQGHWRFYGRQEELAWLTKRLGLDQEPFPDFDLAVGIGGRRGVGKTELFMETMRRHGQTAGSVPTRRCMMVRLAPMRLEGENHVDTLWRGMRQAGMTDLMASMPHRNPEDNPAFRCCDIIRHLLKHGVIVGLDEFHHARNSDLPNELAGMIDKQRCTSTPADQILWGRLVLMGSHQQKFQDMFADDQELYLRARIEYNLQPWPLPIIWEMACDQGWDQNPRRLHTLCTAYGGVPYPWRELAQNVMVPDQLRNWPDPDRSPPTPVSEIRWSQAFLHHELERIVADPRQAWDDKATIELKEPLRSTMIALGHQRSAGNWMSAASVRQDIKNRAINSGVPKPRLPTAQILDQRLLKLHYQTGRVDYRSVFTGLPDNDASDIWTIDDPATLFHIQALGLNRPRRKGKRHRPGLDANALQRLTRLEGGHMERVARDWLDEHPQCLWSEWGVWAPDGRAQNIGDIDALALVGWGTLDDVPQPTTHMLLCVNAKRDSGEHKVPEFQALVDTFMSLKDRDPDIDEIHALPRHHLFVSPVMEPEDRQRLEAAGHLAFDWPSMMAEMAADWPLIRARMPEPPDPGGPGGMGGL